MGNFSELPHIWYYVIFYIIFFVLVITIAIIESIIKKRKNEEIKLKALKTPKWHPLVKRARTSYSDEQVRRAILIRDRVNEDLREYEKVNTVIRSRLPDGPNWGEDNSIQGYANYYSRHYRAHSLTTMIRPSKRKMEQQKEKLIAKAKREDWGDEEVELEAILENIENIEIQLTEFSCFLFRFRRRKRVKRAFLSQLPAFGKLIAYNGLTPNQVMLISERLTNYWFLRVMERNKVDLDEEYSLNRIRLQASVG